MQIGNQKFVSEDGNVLFLILIAVALFAALSYAVTQSSRSSGSGAQDSTSLIQSSQITQYPSSVKTSVLRMQVSNGIRAEELAFNPPSDFSSLSSNPTYAVFHPDGGGATYKHKVTVGQNEVGPWRYLYTEIENIGDGDGTINNGPGDEIIAILPNIPKAICEKLNDNFNLKKPDNADITLGSDYSSAVSSSPKTISDTNGDGQVDSPTSSAITEVIGKSGNTPELTGQAFGCFQNSGGTSWNTGGTEYAYYHVIVER